MKVSSISRGIQGGFLSSAKAIRSGNDSAPARAPQPIASGNSAEHDSRGDSSAREERINQAMTQVGGFLNAKA